MLLDDAEDGGETQAPYEDVAGNAFYCSNGDFVAYDEQGLLPKLRDNFGEFAVGLVFAHELGHGVHAYLSRDQGIFQMSTPLTRPRVNLRATAVSTALTRKRQSAKRSAAKPAVEMTRLRKATKSVASLKRLEKSGKKAA